MLFGGRTTVRLDPSPAGLAKIPFNKPFIAGAELFHIARAVTLANLAGVPGISVPVGFHSSGLPIGLQLLARWGKEELLLDAAARIEKASERRWVDARPGPPSD